MATKRKNPAESQSQNPFPPNKKRFIGANNQSHTDPTTGQRGAFPGLDDEASPGSDSEQTTEALAYLRSVR